MKVYEAKVDFYDEQMGIDTPCPTFSWKTDKKQYGYQLIVETKGERIYDSGHVSGSNHIGISYKGETLHSLTEYDWYVQVWDKARKVIRSSINRFVTGILEHPVALGQWIGNGSSSPFYVKKSIQLTSKRVKSAYALISGVGQFEFSINGKKVGNHVFDQGWTNYDRKILYVMFDIKPYLKENSTMAIEVGNGWYIRANERYSFHMPEFIPSNPNRYQPFGNHLACNGRIEIAYEDGTKDTIMTDGSWQTHASPVKMSNVYGSEIYDARCEIDLCKKGEVWQPVKVLRYDEMPKGKLRASQQQPTIIKKTYEAVSLVEIEKGQVVADFGQNLSALFSFTFSGAKRGQIIDMYPAEKLDEKGYPDQMANGWLLIDTYSTYIAKGDKEETYCPKFAYSAGRYVLIKGATLDKESSKYAYVTEARAYFTTSASNTTGIFHTSDVRYEQIHHLIKMAVECNLNNGIHSDCPQIEKFAWLEPNHLMGPAIMFEKDVCDLWYKIFHDTRIDQWTKDDFGYDYEGGHFSFGEGLIPSQAPCYERNMIPVPGMGSFYDIIPWGSSQILAVHWHYMFYGNIRVIEENYESGVRYLEYMKRKVNRDGFINHGLGDWGNPKEDALARENIETVFLYADAMILGKFAGWLNKSEDQMAFEGYAHEVKNNYNEKLLVKHQTEDFYCYRAFDHQDDIYLTQACEAMPLYWGMVPEDKVADIVQALRYILEKDDKFITGEIGQPYVIQAMREYGMNDLIAKFILKEEHPSYYAFVLAGETTLGEYWEENPRSHCHDMMGHVMEWFYNGMLGIQILKPGCSAVRIRPWMPPEMQEMSGAYESASGRISICVKQYDKKVEVRLEIAGGIDYEIDGSLLEESVGKRVWFSLA